jgi:hypothetical protein
LKCLPGLYRIRGKKSNPACGPWEALRAATEGRPYKILFGSVLAGVGRAEETAAIGNMMKRMGWATRQVDPRGTEMGDCPCAEVIPQNAVPLHYPFPLHLLNLLPFEPQFFKHFLGVFTEIGRGAADVGGGLGHFYGRG